MTCSNTFGPLFLHAMGCASDPCPGLMQIQKVQTKSGGRVLVVPRPKNVPRPSGNLNVRGALNWWCTDLC